MRTHPAFLLSVIRFLASAAFMGAAGCGDGQAFSELVVVVDGDPKVLEQVEQLVVRLVDEAGEQTLARGEVEFAGAGDDGFVATSVSIAVPGELAASAGEVRLVVTGRGTDPERGRVVALVEQQAKVKFRPRERTLVSVFFARACLGLLCRERGKRTERTCEPETGGCGRLPEWFDLPVAAEDAVRQAQQAWGCKRTERDCAGECGGDAVEDCAGKCGGDAERDCAGECGGDAVEDCAGKCGGDAERDCAGECGGDAVEDCAGECGGDAERDCAGACGGNAELDCAGVCGGDAEPDCAGACGGAAKLDCAGTCQGSAESDAEGGCCLPREKDCAGICGGASQADGSGGCCLASELDCAGVCGGGSELGTSGGCCLQSEQDCAGVCGGAAETDGSAACCLPSAQDCAGTCNGSAVVDCSGVCDGNAETDGDGGCCLPSQKDCAGVCNGERVRDSAGGCCPLGFADCNGELSDGCEANLEADSEHCGQCGKICAVVDGYAATCDGGTCGSSAQCAVNRLDLDGDPSNGCEYCCPSGSEEFCGPPDSPNDFDRGEVCEPEQECQIRRGADALGVCSNPGCPAGWGDCDRDPATSSPGTNDGCEVELNTSGACGGCGVSCPLWARNVLCDYVPQVRGHRCVYRTNSTCPFGLADCDEDGVCETDVSSEASCGFCPSQRSTCTGEEYCAFVEGSQVYSCQPLE